MANTYNWKINALDAKIQEGDNSDVIYTVHWTLTATDDTGEYTASLIGTMGVEYDPDNNFIPYADLTKDDVVAWLEAGLDVEAMKENLDNQIELEINPVDETLRPDWD
jgi:hypothetical protein